jgi:hypothetical protein
VFAHASSHPNDQWWEVSLAGILASRLVGDFVEAVIAAVPAVTSTKYGERGARPKARQKQKATAVTKPKVSKPKVGRPTKSKPAKAKRGTQPKANAKPKSKRSAKPTTKAKSKSKPTTKAKGKAGSARRAKMSRKKS